MSKQLTLLELYDNAERINRACATVIENTTAIFLPFKRLDKTNIYKRFLENNQILEITNDENVRVEIRDRLLGQSHKDVLEALLTCPKIFVRKTKQFKIA